MSVNLVYGTLIKTNKLTLSTGNFFIFISLITSHDRDALNELIMVLKFSDCSVV